MQLTSTIRGVAYAFDERGDARLNINPDMMVYATWSRGYRPGGVNRFASIPPYLSDFLDNYEVGWKTTWASARRCAWPQSSMS